MAEIHDLANTIIPSSTISKPRKRKQSAQTSKKGEVEEDDTEWVPSQRETGAITKLWSDNDEIFLLEALRNSHDKSDMIMLHSITMGCFERPFSKLQVSRKVRTLKTKFFNTSEEVLPASTHEAKIRELSREIWGQTQTTTVDVGPFLTPRELEARYPRVSASIDDLPPYNKMTVEAKNVIRECMCFISPEELHEIEYEWADYREGEVMSTAKQMSLSNKESKLLQKGRHAYNLEHRVVYHSH